MPILSITLANSHIFISLNLQSSNLEMPEIKLYNSYNNDRIYYEKQDKYESFYKFIKRKFLAVKSEINNIKL